MRKAAAAGLLAGMLALAATPAAAAEPFYVNLLENGSRDYLRGDYPAAAKKLRVACFGLLDEPAILSEGLIRLALAAAGAGDEDGFTAAVDRLLEVESAFGSYSELPADTAFKGEFERMLAQRFSAEELAAIPAFAAVSARMREAKIAALPPKRQRRELERRLAEDPGDGEALVLLTRLEIAQGREDRAARRLAELLTADPENRMARCVRGQMRLRRDDCAGAMEDLSRCQTPPVDEVLGARYLRCLIAAADWTAAGGYLASLPLEVRGRQEITNLILEIPADTFDSLARAPAGEPEAPAERGSASPAPPGPGAASENAAEAESEELGRRLAAATGRQELDEIYRRLVTLLEARPDSRSLRFLAAEAAYRRSEWAAAVKHFRRTGEPGPDRPVLLFYFAVALFEAGEPAAAADALASALPMLEPTPFVERYRSLILGSPPPG